PLFWFHRGPAGRGALPVRQHGRCHVGLPWRARRPRLDLGRQVGGARRRRVVVAARPPHRRLAGPARCGARPGHTAGAGAAHPVAQQRLAHGGHGAGAGRAAGQARRVRTAWRGTMPAGGRHRAGAAARRPRGGPARHRRAAGGRAGLEVHT
ncbi:unnamed protein product, partial [Phaeothamnion confervicola]